MWVATLCCHPAVVMDQCNINETIASHSVIYAYVYYVTIRKLLLFKSTNIRTLLKMVCYGY